MNSIEWFGESVRFIDQSKLPREESYISTSDYRVISHAIRTLKVRGAPLLGIAAGYAAALAALNSHAENMEVFRDEFEAVLSELQSTRPTAVNLLWGLNKLREVVRESPTVEDAKRRVVERAVELHADDAERCKRIGEHGAGLLRTCKNVLTHCNTGSLATGGEGTALNIIKTAYRMGFVKTVIMGETRPLFQGARLTAWELQKERIPCTLITDSMAGSLMRKGLVDAVVVGADRIAVNGDTANKIGTYPLAVLAHHHRVSFYVAAPGSTIDANISSGSVIPIEERLPEEITGEFSPRIAPEGTSVFNPAFDITPAELITAIVTDIGVFRAPYDFRKIR